MRLVRVAIAGTLAIFFLGSCAWLPGADGRHLTAVIDAYAKTAMRLDAFDAPVFDIEENLDKFGDYLAPEHRERERAAYQDALEGLQAVDVAQLSEAQKLEYRLFHDDVTLRLEALAYPVEFLEFNQMSNRLSKFLDESNPALTYFPFDSVGHYEAWLRRAAGLPAYLDRQIETLRRGVQSGFVLNCTVGRSVIRTYEQALERQPEKSPFHRPVSRMPAGFTAREREALTREFRRTIGETLVPAIAKFDRYFREEYLPHCRSTYGVKELPDGAALYQHLIRVNTDLDWPAEKIHRLGLEEVARITGAMIAVKDELGFTGSLSEFRRAVLGNESYFFATGQELFAAFAAYGKEVDAAVPRLFNHRPATPLRLEESENPEYAAGSYTSPTDGQPVGRFIVNTKNLRALPKYGVKTLYLHEAIPGHHYQLAIQFEMKQQLSEYRRKLYDSNAFAEGWALYAERLGLEEGLMPEALQRLGSLNDEMLRAVRLVVDTGIHHYGWTRERAIAYMSESLTSDPRDIEIEADRYSVWPGQALGYKIGQIRILELREKARNALGPKFDIRAFHDVVIGQGMLSLGVLEGEVDAWIEASQRAAQ